jgi:hypothetical protein
MRFVCSSLIQPPGRRRPAVRFCRVALIGAFGIGTCSAQNGGSDGGSQWLAHVRYLADDRLEGRLTGTEGYRKAAQYVADHFKEYGLEPGGTQGYFQPVKFDVQQVIASASKLTLNSGGKQTSVHLGESALLGGRLPQPKEVSAPLVLSVPVYTFRTLTMTISPD